MKPGSGEAVAGGGGAVMTAADPDARLRGWKEIGRRFGVDERTVKRWEISRGLPVHRVPGEPRAPVYAYERELSAWLATRGAPPATPEADPAPLLHASVARPPLWRRQPTLAALGVILLVAGALMGWRGWELAGQRRTETLARVADVRQLAQAQVAALNDRLEKQPGTVQTRVALNRDAAAVLARIAALPDATPELQRDAAEAWLRLASVQSSIDRPSLRDRTAARASLDQALALVTDDAAPAGRWLRARILARAARLAAGDGAIRAAAAMLVPAAAAARGAPPAVQEEVRLAQAEVANWRGDYTAAIRLAAPLAEAPPPADSEAGLRRLQALDFMAEAQFYRGEQRAARDSYALAVAAARSGLARWPDEPRWRWALQRQQWNLGSTLTELGDPAAAVPLLLASRNGWMAMARADPQDESLAAWVRVTQLSHGEALRAAGQPAAAIAELAATLADRRLWLADRPDSPERQRGLVTGLNALADALAVTGRAGEACPLLAEAGAITARMARAGSLTALDQDMLVKPGNAIVARHCRAEAA